ncbi:MAG TPA: hypothetical protein VKC60_00865 [Opitutaceae bacterium]|nr:hypothetical protein [Opitutaceae bacterium]
MLTARTIAWILAAICLGPVLRADEVNNWPARVEQRDASGRIESWQGAGPFLFHKSSEPGTYWSGFRPFYVAKHNASGQVVEWSVVYPIFTYRGYGESGYRWSVFSLLNYDATRSDNQKERDRTEIVPFYFARETGDPATSYHAIFPIAGTIKERWGSDEIKFVLFPLYSRTNTRGVIVTESPWPFIKTIHGGGQHGFYLWPLFGWREKEGSFYNRFWLWPFVFKSENLDPENKGEKVAVLPFYLRETSPGMKSETFLWPFFGYTDRAANPPETKEPYHETRYFWPFLLQARGDQIYRNRWAPFYTHSIVKGYDKTWVMWPIVRKATWQERNIVETKSQVLGVVYWSLVQRSATNPDAEPATKTHMWPLYSAWNNGAGRRQFQLFSPLEPLLQVSDHVRVAWSPFFAIYRFDQPQTGDVRHSFLFDFVTWHRQPTAHEFHLGPLFSVQSSETQSRIAVGNGIFAMERSGPGASWHFSWFNFNSNAALKGASATHS